MTLSESDVLGLDGALMMSNFPPLLSECICWGAYIVTFAFTFHCLSTREVKRRSWHVLMGLVITMFAMSTSLLILDMFGYVWKIKSYNMDVGTREFSERTKSALTVWGPSVYALDWIFSVQFLLGDAIVIWRAWVLWRGSWPVLIPAMTWTASLGILVAERLLWVTSGNYKASLGHGGASSFTHLRAVNYALSLAVNAFATALIALKSWYYRRHIKAFLHSSRPTMVERILTLLIESGLAYLCFWSIAILTNFHPTFNPPLESFINVWTCIGNQFVGLYPTLIIALVELARSMHDQLDIILCSTTVGQAPQPAGSNDSGMDIAHMFQSSDTGTDDLEGDGCIEMSMLGSHTDADTKKMEARGRSSSLGA